MFCPSCHDEYPETWKVCPKDATELLASSRIGKYTITARIGAGGMGAVYKAVNPDTRSDVAIKVMHPDAAASEPARQRFKREAAAVAKLKTSHVVKVYDFGAADDGTLYLVMELLDGHALRDEIHPPPDTMPLARAQFVIDGVLKGLAAAHKAGIVHRDLKPENIFLAQTDDGEVPRLLDFGVARVESPTGTLAGQTRPGTVIGTAVYMAPEQLQGLVSQTGTWSDVYAVGAMLYEMLAGKTPVTSGSLAEVLIQVRRRRIAPLAELRPDLPPALCALVHQCLEVEEARRPQTAEDLRAALATVWGTPAIAPPPSRPRSNPMAAVAETVAPDAAPPSRSNPLVAVTEAPDSAPMVAVTEPPTSGAAAARVAASRRSIVVIAIVVVIVVIIAIAANA